MTYKTEQEAFWAGEFGDEYLKRNQGKQTIASNIALFSKILASVHSPKTIIEFGSNIGLNLEALSILLPDVKLSAIEINQKAVEILKLMDNVSVQHTSILNYKPDQTHDLTLIKGVLIHINPQELQAVYDRLYQSSHRYICIAEYYNPSPVEIGYRGHEGKLFKRDFAGEMLDKYPGLKLLDYGFVYHRDNHFPQDDISWFLLEKELP